MTYVTYLKIFREEPMKSRYASKPDAPCPLCGLPWAAGAPISKWLGDWVHEPCKALKMASVASEGVRTVLPEARGWADTRDTLVRTPRRGKAFRSKVM